MAGPFCWIGLKRLTLSINDCITLVLLISFWDDNYALDFFTANHASILTLLTLVFVLLLFFIVHFIEAFFINDEMFAGQKYDVWRGIKAHNAERDVFERCLRLLEGSFIGRTFFGQVNVLEKICRVVYLIRKPPIWLFRLLSSFRILLHLSWPVWGNNTSNKTHHASSTIDLTNRTIAKYELGCIIPKK